MKKAEDIASELFNGLIGSTYERKIIVKNIKQIQEDAIRETAKLCSESAQLSYAQYNCELPEYCEEPFNCTCDERENWHYIDRNYILDVGDKLIKEL